MGPFDDRDFVEIALYPSGLVDGEAVHELGAIRAAPALHTIPLENEA